MQKMLENESENNKLTAKLYGCYRTLSELEIV